MARTKPPLMVIEPTPTRFLRQKVDVFHPRNKHGISRLLVRSLPNLSDRSRRGVLSVGPLSFQCAIGRRGIGAKRFEGDSMTPLGSYKIVEWYGRFDQFPGGRSRLQMISREKGWCDDPTSFCYNRPVWLPCPFRTEALWRDDQLYDLVGVIDFNFRPRIRGRGSAIFIHVAREDLAPTEGCIAVAGRALQILHSMLSAKPQILIGAENRRRFPKIAEPTRT